MMQKYILFESTEEMENNNCTWMKEIKEKTNSLRNLFSANHDNHIPELIMCFEYSKKIEVIYFLFF